MSDAEEGDPDQVTVAIHQPSITVWCEIALVVLIVCYLYSIPCEIIVRFPHRLQMKDLQRKSMRMQ